MTASCHGGHFAARCLLDLLSRASARRSQRPYIYILQTSIVKYSSPASLVTVPPGSTRGREGRGKYFLYLPYVLLRQAQLRIIAPWQTTRASSTGPEIDRSDFDRDLKQPLNFQRKRPTWFFRLIVCTHSIVRDSFPFGVGPSPSPKEHPRIPAQTHRTTLLQSRTC